MTTGEVKQPGNAYIRMPHRYDYLGVLTGYRKSGNRRPQLDDVTKNVTYFPERDYHISVGCTHLHSDSEATIPPECHSMAAIVIVRSASPATEWLASNPLKKCAIETFWPTAGAGKQRKKCFRTLETNRTTADRSWVVNQLLCTIFEMIFFK